VSVIWRKPVLTYAVSVVSLTASVNSVNSVNIGYMLLIIDMRVLQRTQESQDPLIAWRVDEIWADDSRENH